jgi:hypothetical protein
MRKVVITPSGRKAYLQLLFQHLASQKNDFDEWHLWLNTVHEPDLVFCRELSARHSWIKTIDLTVPHANGSSIYSFYKNCLDTDTAYLRIDDDVVWLEPDFVAKMFDYRLRHPEFFLVFGNIVNNAVISHIYQRCGLVDSAHGKCMYDCLCGVGWASPDFALTLHTRFLRDIARGTIDRWRCFPEWRLYGYERVSINAISFLGSDIAKISGVVDPDEEPAMACHIPNNLGKICSINGNALCAHFAFYPQRGVLDATDILAAYAKFAPAVEA